MTKKILGIGNAIVDLIIKSDDNLIAKNGLAKGSMGLIQEAQARSLSSYRAEKITSGGSVANTIAALAQLGSETSFVGKVGNDSVGKKFIEEIEKTGCKFLNKNFDSSASARSFILVSPDAERTMATFLGCAANLTENDIKEEYFADAGILYVEGYLWDAPSTILALKKAITLAKKNDVKIAFSISDAFCVLRHKQDFIDLIQNDIDILFANENEAMELVSKPGVAWTELVVELKLFFASNKKLIPIVTRSEKGCAIFASEELIEIAAEKVSAVDSTGAGDAFAAGLLYGIANNFSLEKSAALANKMGATIIQKFGARFSDEEIAEIKKTAV